jgi:hypothetical protein
MSVFVTYHIAQTPVFSGTGDTLSGRKENLFKNTIFVVLTTPI